MKDGYGIPLGRVLVGANRHDCPMLAPTLDRLEGLVPLPDTITVHLDACYDSDTARALLSKRGLHGRIAHKGEKAPIQASRRWHVERTHAWQNAFTVSPGATSVASPSSMPSSTSPTQSSPCAARSCGPGQLNAGTNARTADHGHTPTVFARPLTAARRPRVRPAQPFRLARSTRRQGVRTTSERPVPAAGHG